MNFGKGMHSSKLSNRSSGMTGSSMVAGKKKETFWDFVKRIASKFFTWGSKAYSMSKYVLWCASIGSEPS